MMAMNNCRNYRGILKIVAFLGVSVLALLPQKIRAVEETFPTLQVGTHVYTNVTVTTKAKSYIFILHSAGMENIRVADLPEDLRTQLGYMLEVPKGQKASNWAKDKMAGFHIGQVNAKELKDPKMWQEQSAIVLQKARALDHKMCGAIMGGLLLVYLFFCYCCMLICQKTGQEPGMLVWVPFFQIYPLLRAAEMSPLWSIAYFFGLPGMVAHIIWCFKISGARGKSPLAGLALLLPGISLFAFLYLAFSDSVPEAEPITKEDKRTSRLMTLETA